MSAPLSAGSAPVNETGPCDVEPVMRATVTSRFAVTMALALGAVSGAGCAGVDHTSASTSGLPGPRARVAAVPPTDPVTPMTTFPPPTTVPTSPGPAGSCGVRRHRRRPVWHHDHGGGTTWAEQVVDPGTCPQALDLAAGAAFALVSQSAGSEGPWQLERFDVDRAVTESGPTFGVMTMAVAAGYLWIGCGPTVGEPSRPLLCQVDPDSLAVVGQVTLPPAADAWVRGNGPQVVARARRHHLGRVRPDPGPRRRA